MNENTIPTPSALAASPRSLKGCPSKVVATELPVPGIFNKIADISPPDVPPMYSAHSIEKASTGSMPKVSGKQSATPSVAVMPGSAPKRIPSAVPSNIMTMLPNVLTSIRPSRNNCIHTPLELEADYPAGSMTLKAFTKAAYITMEKIIEISAIETGFLFSPGAKSMI
jgi:hypothetical protein